MKERKEIGWNDKDVYRKIEKKKKKINEKEKRIKKDSN